MVFFFSEDDMDGKYLEVELLTSLEVASRKQFLTLVKL